jgi:ERCC4-related helicase
MTHHEELIALAKGIGLFTDEGCEALVSYMQRQEEHSERLQAIRKLSEIGDYKYVPIIMDHSRSA